MSASVALGVRPRTWQMDEPADFLGGTLENLALSSRAELLLAPRTQRFELDAKEADTVNAIVIGPDNTPYLGTGPAGTVFRLARDMPEKFVSVPEGQVFSLLFLEDESLLVGTGGRHGVIYRVNRDGIRSTFWQSSAVRYIWSMVRDADGAIYAATGTRGEIYRISPDGKTATVLARLSPARNVLALAMDSDRLAFGTDSNGLVGSISTRSRQVRVLLDVGNRNVSALRIAPDGAIYASTTGGGDKGGGETTPSRPRGRPDDEGGNSAGTSMGSSPPTVIEAGDPSPAEPQPPGAAHQDAKAQPENGVPVKARASMPGSATLPFGRSERSEANALYRIDPNGQTSEIVALPAMLLSMSSTHANLLIGTGSPGRLYLVQPEQERYTALLREDTAFFSALACSDNGCWVGTSRPAAAVHVLPGYAHKGVYTSAPQDAGQVAQWGQVCADLTLPSGTSASIQTRSNNLHEPNGPGWSEWSEPTPLGEEGGARIASPPARFLQFRLVLTANRANAASPVVRSITIPYMTLNLAPEISSLSVTVPDVTSARRGAGGQNWPSADSTLPMEWQARDPNGDSLVYQVDLRQAAGRRWIRIAEDLRKTSYAWDSSTVPDGRYEARVTADDSPDNTPGTALSKSRISEPFMVDNTPPRIENLRSAVVGQSIFRIQTRLVDAGGPLVAAQYAVDSAKDWVALLPSDGIFDSSAEALDFVVGPLSAGEHVLALRVVDSHGNTGRVWLTLTVE